MGKLVNRAELAEIFGYSLPTVDAWIKENCPVKSEGGRGKSYQFDTEEVHRWLLGREKRAGRPAKSNEPNIDPETGEEKISLEEAQRRKAVADAQKSELALAKDLDLVAPIETLLKLMSDEIANARARLLAIPTKLRPDAQIHAASPERAKKLVAKVEDLIRDALSEIKTHEGAK